MLIYYVVPLLLYILSFVKSKNNYIEKILILILGIFLCTSYFSGSDWRQYELMYNKAEFSEIFKFYAEKGFYLWMCFFNFFKIEFFNFFIITKLICFYLFYKKIKQYNLNERRVYLFGYATMMLFLFIDCPLRQLIAVSLTLNLDNYITKKKYFKFILIFLIAFTFHKSVIIWLSFLFLKNIYKLKKEILILILILITIVCTNLELIMNLIYLLPTQIASRLLIYMGTEYFESKIFTLGTIDKIIIVFILIYKKDDIIQKYTRGKELIIGIILFYSTYRLGMTINILTREVLYFYLYYILGIVIFIENFKSSLIRNILFLFFLLYQLLLTNKMITNNYKYYPYTSYIPYIFQEKPSYEYRSNFNIIEFKKRFNKN